MTTDISIKDRGENILELNEVAVNYGPMRVLTGIDLYVKRAEVVAILGPNGAGKTTLMRAIAGLLPVTTGRVIFNGRNIKGLATQQIVRLGISLVPQGRLLFPSMTAYDNVRLGAYLRRSENENIRTDMAMVFRLFPKLEERRRQVVATLSGGEQQMVAIGRGLMSRPQLLMLDEPSIGLAPLLVKELMSVLVKLKDEQGISTLLAEQSVEAALTVADRGYVLAKGRVALDGSNEELRANDAVKAAYLGKPT